MSGKQQSIEVGNYKESQKQSEAKFIEIMEICLHEGWSPTKCPDGYIART